MNTITSPLTGVFFDTRANIKKLWDAGLTEKQAEVHTEILSQLIKDDLVTKGYLDLRIKDIELKMKEVKFEIIKWVAVFLLAQTGVITALVKLL